MSIGKRMLPEFEIEMAVTRTMLERVPEDKLDWAPHPKSMTMGRLASHLAEMPSWSPAFIEADEWDMAPTDGGAEYSPPNLGTVAEMLDVFDQGVVKAKELLANVSDEAMLSSWSFKRAGEILSSAPKISVIRRMLMNHLIHHRAQLGIYLRLNDVPVPQTFGPTADESEFSG